MNGKKNDVKTLLRHIFQHCLQCQECFSFYRPFTRVKETILFVNTSYNAGLLMKEMTSNYSMMKAKNYMMFVMANLGIVVAANNEHQKNCGKS